MTRTVTVRYEYMHYMYRATPNIYIYIKNVYFKIENSYLKL